MANPLQSVVCNNTLAIAVNGAASAIKVPHNTRFDADSTKQELGVAVAQWDGFMYRMRMLAERKVKAHEAMAYFLRVVCDHSSGAVEPANLINERALKKIQLLYDGHGRGSEMDSARGTAWGLLNAVTEFVDHEKQARSTDHRLDSAWFGQGAQLKQRALQVALQMVS